MRLLDRHKILLLLLLGTVVGFSIRIPLLDEIPGFEHDEALICLGAKSIANEAERPLTGDKVYEGPLLEYLIAVPMFFGEPSVWTARLVMMLAGGITIVFTYFAGAKIGGPSTGLFSAFLIVFSVWHLAASRVVYACNLSQLFIPVWLWSVTSFVKSRKTYLLILAGLALGFAANGRFTAYLLIISTVVGLFVYARKKSFTGILLFLLTAFIPFLPTLIYNAWNHWPAVDILRGPTQAHLSSSWVDLFPRMSGYLTTLIQALSGQRYWLDIDWTPALPIYILPLLLFWGIVRVIWKSEIGRFERMILLTSFCLLMLIVPILTKVVPNLSNLYHPHYLDLVFPFVNIFCGIALSSLWKKNRAVAVITLFLTLAWQMHFLFMDLVPSIGCEEMPGRWSGRSTSIASCIKKTCDPSNTLVVAPWQFGGGYPQLAFLLPEFCVRPFLSQYVGQNQTDGRWSSYKVVRISPFGSLGEPPWTTAECHAEDKRFYTYQYVISPGFLLDGRWLGEDGRILHIRTQKREHENGWPLLIVEENLEMLVLDVHSRRNIEMGGFITTIQSVNVSPRHFNNLQLLDKQVVAHQLNAVDDHEKNWEFVFSCSEQNTSERRVQVTIGSYRMNGRWSGVCEFF